MDSDSRVLRSPLFSQVLRSALGIVLLLLGSVALAHGQIYVDAAASSGGSGTSWSDAYADLQTALTNAASGDSIWIAEGVYKPTSGTDESVSFTISGAKDGVKLFGGFEAGDTFAERSPGDHPTILSGDIGDNDTDPDGDGIIESASDISGSNSYHVLFLDGAGSQNITENTVIDGLTITGGQANGGSNQSDPGGGVFCDGRGSGNACNATFRNVVIIGNSADAGGGGVHNAGNSQGTASPKFVNAVFYGNSAVAGGAMNNLATSNPEIVNSVFMNNSATSGSGGGILNDASLGGTVAPTISNVILWGNTATSGGDQLHNAGTGATPTVANTILEGGINGIGGTAITDNGGNLPDNPLFSRPSVPEGPDGRFATADDGLTVRPGSPAIDAGSNQLVNVTSDLTGASRVEDNNGDAVSTVDIGPYEGAVEPQVFHVNASSTASSPDGLSWGKAYSDLQAALSIAIETDEIWIAKGVYVPGSSQSASFGIAPGQDGLELYGGFAGGETTRSDRDPSANATVLSGDIGGDDQRNGSGVTPDTASITGDNAEHVIVMSGTSGTISQSTVIDGVTVTGGQANGGIPHNRGGGLWCNGFGLDACNPTLRNVRFVGNAADEGGAIYNEGGVASPTITNAVFAGNGATIGGAIYNRGGITSTLALTNAVFVNNTAVKGGAIANVAPGGTASPLILNATIANNSAQQGGAIFDSTSSAGTAVASVDNSILWGNTAPDGSQIYNIGAGATPEIDHSILEDGAAGTSENNTSTTRFLDGSDGITTFVSSTNLDRNPQFEYFPLPRGDDGTFATADDGVHLVPGSPALDAGDFAALDTTGNGIVDISTDVTGGPRNQDSDGDGNNIVNMGAYETARDQARTVFVDASASGLVDGTSWATADTTLQDTLDLATGALGYVTGNDEIWIAKGVYTPAGADTSLTLRGTQDGLAMYGGFDGTETTRSDRTPGTNVTVLSGDVGNDDARTTDGVTPDTAAIAGPNANHVLLLDGESLGPITSSTVLSGLTITGGQANGANPENRGGGLYCAGAISGGACNPTLRDLVFIGNLADANGGAVYNAGENGTASPLFRDVFFLNNLARFSGGALYNDGRGGQSSPTLVNTVFAANTAYTDAGAMYNLGTFSGAADPTITNATMAANRAERDGGAIVNRGGSSTGTAAPTITNTILWGNTASSQGVTGDDQIYNDLGTPSFAHSIVEGSGGSSNWASGLGTDNGGNLDQDPMYHTPTQPAGADGQFGTIDDSLNLTPGSPALDAGTNGPVSASTDVTGATRIQDLDVNGTATVNIGAYEQPVQTAPIPGAPSITTVADSGASVSGTVNPGGSQTTAELRVYPTGAPGNDTLFAVNENPLSGFVEQAVTVDPAGLLPATSYEAELVASNSLGTDTSGVASFTTQAAAPIVAADSVNSRTDSGAALFGRVNPGGALARVYVKLGRAASTGHALHPLDTLQTNLLSDQPVGAQPDTLRSATQYEFAIVAASSVDSLTSDTLSFTTANAPPTGMNLARRARSAISTRIPVLSGVTADGVIDTSSVRIESAPSHGTATPNADGTVTYQHDGSTQLTDQFTYSVADKAGQRSAPATVQINVVSIGVAEKPATRGSAVSLDVTVDGTFAPTMDTTLFARRGGTSTYRALPLQVGSGGSGPLQLSGEIPDSLVTTRGIDYYVVLTDSADTFTVPSGGTNFASSRPRHVSVQFDSLQSPLPAPAKAYQMVSVPAIPDAGVKEALQNRFGPYNRQRWRALRWDPSSKQYQEYPQIDTLGPGRGLWLTTSRREALSVGTGRTVDADTATTMVLPPGWTQIGTPYGYAVPWNRIMAASGLTGAEIDGPVSYTSGAYQRGVSQLKPWRGYFVFNAQTQPDTLVIPPSGPSPTSSGSGRPAALTGTGAIGSASASVESGPSDAGPSGSANKYSGAPGYTLRMELNASATPAQRIWMGLRDGAKRGRDTLDFAQPPPVGQPVRASIVHRMNGRTIRHAGSFKPTGGDGQSWRIQLQNRSDDKHTVRVLLASAGELPAGQDRYVLDLEDRQRLASPQKVSLGPGQSRELKVLVGTERYARQHSEEIPLKRYETGLRANYPNPFSEETTVTYTLSNKQHVTLEIYNVLGQRVRTLVRGPEEAGRHRIDWNGENTYGNPVGSGVYFYRLEAGNVTETRKMVLVR